MQYSTIHSARGKEADYIAVIDVTAGGLPSTIEDDPLLALAMPAAERHRHAEEGRLFYVALTRTRRSRGGWHRSRDSALPSQLNCATTYLALGPSAGPGFQWSASG